MSERTSPDAHGAVLARGLTRTGIALGMVFALWLVVGCSTPRAASRVKRNILYGQVGEKKLFLDLLFPTGATSPCPVVVNLHGGAWTEGIRSVGTSWLAAPELLRRGYAFASIDYRLAPRYKFPAQIEDAKCAVRFLRSHAAEFGLDPDRIVALGSSAGGHLSALLGTTDAGAGFDASGGWTNVSSRVQAVVDMFGPADLNRAAQEGERLCLVANRVFGTKSTGEILRRASPVNYVSPEDPPFLLIHGERDRTVPLHQSELMRAALRAQGVPAELVVVKRAGHCLVPVRGMPTPSHRELGQIIADFVDRALARPRLVSNSPPVTASPVVPANLRRTP